MYGHESQCTSKYYQVQLFLRLENHACIAPTKTKQESNRDLDNYCYIFSHRNMPTALRFESSRAHRRHGARFVATYHTLSATTLRPFTLKRQMRHIFCLVVSRLRHQAINLETSITHNGLTAVSNYANGDFIRLPSLHFATLDRAPY